MTYSSISFEKQIKRIYDVLIRDSAIVTWNDRIKDPDNPKQLRQIDISIRRDNELTHVECRAHKHPQDSKWIEELFGRKISLQAVSMIAVSQSGFTEGAIKKAKKLGVFLFNLNQLTDVEILSWGRKTKVKFLYYQFRNLNIRYLIKNIKDLNINKTLIDIRSKVEYNNDLLNQIKYHLNKDITIQFPYKLEINFSTKNGPTISDKKILGVIVNAIVDKIALSYSCPSVFYYSAIGESSEIIATVEKNELSLLEIIKSSLDYSSVSIDLSIAPKSLPNCVLSGVTFDNLPGSIENPPKFNVIGNHDHHIYINELQVEIAEII